MRHSPLRHPLAVLRTELGLTQSELGELIGRERPTVQKIELRKLRLTEDLATKISAETGVSARWLLEEDNPNAQMVTPEGKPYTKEIFEALQAHPKARQLTVKMQDQRELPAGKLTEAIQDPKELDMLYMRGVYVTADWFPMYSAAAKAGKREIAEHLTLKFLKEMRERFGFDMAAAQNIDAEIRFKNPKKIRRFAIPQRQKPPS